VITPSERSDDNSVLVPCSRAVLTSLDKMIVNREIGRGLVQAVENRRFFCRFSKGLWEAVDGVFLLRFEAVHGFPQPVSVHRPLGAKRRL